MLLAPDPSIRAASTLLRCRAGSGSISAMAAGTRVECPQCGAPVPDIDGPVHKYVPAAPGCWKTFGEVQADELQRFGYSPAHRLVVDAYMAQHPGDGSDRRDRQSVFAHLCGLYARLELDLPAAATTDVLGRVVASRDDFPVLRRDDGPGRLTILDMIGSRDVDIYDQRARAWGEAVWRSWTSHHGKIVVAVSDVGGA